MTTSCRSFALLLVLSLVLLQPLVASAASVRLTDASLIGDVTSFKISPDGRYVVYEVHDFGQLLHQWSLFSVPLVGGASVPLADVAEVNLGEVAYFISPDSSRVFYGRPHADSYFRFDLWSVPIAGPATAATHLAVADGEYSGLQPSYSVTPDGAAVLYTRTDMQTLVRTLYVLPAGGPETASRALSLPDESVTWFQLLPDGAEAVYGVATEPIQVFRVPLNGPAQVRFPVLMASVWDLKDVSGLQVTGDGRSLVFTALPGGETAPALYRVELAASVGRAQPPARLSAPGVSVSSFALSPTGDRVVFRWSDTPNTFRYYSVPITGPASVGVPISLPRPPWSSGDCLRISPDGKTVVYCARTYDEPELYPYAVPIDGPAESSIRLGAPIGNDAYFELQLTPDGRRLLYEVDAYDQAMVHRLYSAPVSGPSADYVTLSEQLNVWGTPYWGVQVSPDSSRALFPDTRDPRVWGELHVVPVEGPASAAIRLNQDLEPNTGVGYHAFAPDSSRVVYTARQVGDSLRHLYVADDGQTQVGFGAYEMVVAENAGTVRVPVRLSRAAVLPVTVTARIEQGYDVPAEGNGIDYRLPSATVTIPPGETEGFLTLVLVEDGVPEQTETFFLALTDPENAGLSGMSRIRIRIVDWAGYVPQVGR